MQKPRLQMILHKISQNSQKINKLSYEYKFEKNILSLKRESYGAN